MQVVLSVIGALGWFLLMTNSERIRNSSYWLAGWLGSLLCLALTYPAVAAVCNAF